VLSLGKVERRGIGYYFETTGAGRAGLVEADGRWLGSLAASLGVSGIPVAEGDLRALLEGVDPRSGEILDVAHRRVRVVALDAVFAAPKSVSVVHALRDGETDAFAEAHEKSVEAVVAYLEDHVALVRRTGPHGRNAVRAEGLAAAAFLHRTSRAPDPHLHSHVVIANLGVDDSGRWSALDTRALFQHRRAAGALYGAELRRELAERRGVSWRARRPGAVDIAEVPERAIRGFSRRGEQIRAEQARTGAVGPGDARRIGTWTRPPKDTETPYEVLVENWRERADTLGIPPSLLAGRPPRPRAEGEDRSLEGRVGIIAAVERAVRSFDAPFLRRELIASVAGDMVEGARARDVETVADAVLSSPAVLDARLLPGAHQGLRDRLPPPLAERRYVSGAAAARIEAVWQAIEAAPSLGEPVGAHLPGRPRRANAELVGLAVDRGGGRGALRTLEMLHEMASDAAASARRVIGVAPYEALAGHLEALTGITAVTPDRFPLPRHGDLIVAFGASRLASRTAAVLLERAEHPGAGVVFVDLPTLHRDGERPDPGRVIPDAPGSVRIEGTPHGTVVLASEIAAIPEALARGRAHVEARGRRPVVVVAERGLAADLDDTAHSPGAARRLLERAEVELVVLGGARVLRSGRSRQAGDRTFVGVVSPAASPEETERVVLKLATGREAARGEMRHPPQARERTDRDLGIGGR